VTLCLLWHASITWSLVQSWDVVKLSQRRLAKAPSTLTAFLPLSLRNEEASSNGATNSFQFNGDLIEAAGVNAYDAVSNVAMNTGGLVGGGLSEKGKSNVNQRTVDRCIQRVEQDMQMLDSMVGNKAQLTGTEFAFLLSCSAIAGLSPFFFPIKVVEVLAPSAAALSAAVGISAEYVGKTAVSNGKEVAAITIIAAAEAEAILATAERAKAIVPLCVGIATTASAFALLAPALLEDIGLRSGVELMTELYLISPLVAVLSAAVAGLAYQETQSLCGKAMGTGTRRFAKSDSVGKTWLSTTEMVEAGSFRQQQKFTTFAVGILPSPFLAVLCPGPLGFKAVIAASAAACQAAYYLTCSEYEVAKTTDAVALKARAAAVADTYANQGARSGAILPFTSALGGLCAAAAAATVEVMPFIAHDAVFLQSGVSFLFPALASFIAAAASVSKARCEVDAAAAKAAAETFADAGLLSTKMNEKNTLEPLRGVLELMTLTVSSIFMVTKRTAKRTLLRGKLARRWLWAKLGLVSSAGNGKAKVSRGGGGVEGRGVDVADLPPSSSPPVAAA